MNIIDLVEGSYDKIAAKYASARIAQIIPKEVARFSSALPTAGKVLDVGCGVGLPAAKFLVGQGFRVIGIDISQRMIDLAQANVPQATFVKKNILTLDFADDSFDGLICIDTLWHVPKNNHLFIFQNFARILKNNGLLLINTKAQAMEGMEDFYGEPMFWSNYPPTKTLELLEKAKYKVAFKTSLKREKSDTFWVLATIQKK
ncbi:MAG: class I SAM-dependent methyltransferase [Candidatus Heimdallarchaeota archaeon]|nr:class I SAM-dependent methyltransferase [Candidatus Heimdallarchaeota archaeon]